MSEVNIYEETTYHVLLPIRGQRSATGEIAFRASNPVVIPAPPPGFENETIEALEKILTSIKALKESRASDA